MSLDIDIKVDAPGAIPTIAGVESALGKVEAAGPRAGAAISSGLRESSVAAEKAKLSTLSALEQFQKMANLPGPVAYTEALKREQEMLDQILKPQRMYAEGLQSLDGLLSKNMISTEQYADQVTKLNKAIGETPSKPHDAEAGGGIEGSLGKAVAGQFGEAGSVLGSLASGSAIEAAAVVGLGVELIKLSDDYVLLSNSAMRLVGTNGDVSGTIQNQLALSKEVHGSLEQTMELSTLVKERTEDLGMSTARQTELTKALAEEAVLSGRSAGDMAQTFSALGFAIESGLPAGRQMRTAMSEFPPLADALKEHFNASTAEIVSMAQHGKISMEEFAKAQVEHAAEMSGSMSRVHETFGQTMGHIKDTFVANGNMIEDAVGSYRESLWKAQDPITQWLVKNKDLIETTKQLASAEDKLRVITADIVAEFKKLDDADFGKAESKVLEDLHGGSQTYMMDQRALLTLLGEGRIVAPEFTKEMKKLNEEFGKKELGITGVLSQFQKDINNAEGPIDTLHDRTEQLGRQLDMGAVSWERYNAEMEKARSTYEKMMELPAPRVTTSIDLADPNSAQANAIKAIKFTGPSTKAQAEQMNAEEKSAAEMYKVVATPSEKYADELDKINKLQADGYLVGDKYNRVVDALKDKYTTIKTPAEQYAASVKKIQQEQETGLVSLEAYDDAMRKLRLDSGQGTFADGATQGFKDIVKEAHSSANDVSAAFKKGFDGINDNIVSFVTTGKTDFGSFFTSLEGDFAKAALKKAESGLFDLLGGAGDSSGASGAAASAIQSGGAHADGGSYTAPPGGGVDSHAVMFRMSPGERADFTPQGSGRPRESQQQATGRTPPTQVHIHMQNDKRDLVQGMNSPDGQRVLVRLNRKLGR